MAEAGGPFRYAMAGTEGWNRREASLAAESCGETVSCVFCVEFYTQRSNYSTHYTFVQLCLKVMKPSLPNRQNLYGNERLNHGKSGMPLWRRKITKDSGLAQLQTLHCPFPDVVREHCAKHVVVKLSLCLRF